MPRLVLLSEGYTGRSYELKAETTTVGRVSDNAFEIPEASVSSHHAELARVLGMSIAVQAIRVVQAWCLGKALGIDLPLLTYLALVPVILLIMQIPITINGLGTTQVAFVTLLGASGAAAPEATALSILFLVLGVIGSLPGGVLYAFADTPEPPGAHAS